MKKRRKVSLARRSKAVRIREQRGELRGWDADLGKVFDDNEDREALRKASTPKSRAGDTRTREKHMKAITTKYIGPTNYRGSRIKASDEDGNAITISYPHELSGEEVYRKAAVALCTKIGNMRKRMASYLFSCSKTSRQPSPKRRVPDEKSMLMLWDCTLYRC